MSLLDKVRGRQASENRNGPKSPDSEDAFHRSSGLTALNDDELDLIVGGCPVGVPQSDTVWSPDLAIGPALGPSWWPKDPEDDMAESSERDVQTLFRD